MRTIATRPLFATALGALLLIAGALPVLGYIEQPTARVLVSAPQVVKCNQSPTIGVRVVDVKTGKPVWQQVVNFRLIGAQSSGDRLSASRATTNRQGRTSVRLSFGPVAGARKISVSIPNSKPVVTIRCAGGLPKTSAVPPPDYEEAPPSMMLENVVAPPPAVSPTGDLPATSIRVRRLGIELPIVEGDGYRVPEGAVAHYPDTAWPDEGSNTYIYGHAREHHFLELWRVRDGDLVEIDMADGSTAAYRVSEIHPLVQWDALEYLAPSDREILTLQTCLTYEDTAPRFVVIAERIPSA